MYKSNGYYVNQHSYFLLQYHLVLVTKYRHPVITDDIKSQLVDYTQGYFAEQKLNLMEVNTDTDHIHILFEAYPNFNISTFVNAYKSASSRYIRKHNQEFLRSYYWKPYFWSNSYFIGTVSEKTTQAVQVYIQKQGKDS